MTLANLFGALEGPDLLIILLIVLVLFGGAKLPQLARSLGEAKREFHHATSAPADAASPDGPAASDAGTQAASDTVTMSRDEFERLRSMARPSTPPDQRSN